MNAPAPKSELVKIDGARLPAPGNLFKNPELKMTQSKWLTLCNTTYKDVEDPKLLATAIIYAHTHSLDILRRHVEIVDFGGGKQVTLGVHGLNALAENSGLAGTEDPVFGPEKEFNFGGVRITAPEWCSIAVFKRNKDTGIVDRYAGTRIYFKEAVRCKKDGTPMKLWRERPMLMLQKNAYAGTLRMACPNTIGGNYSADEVQGYDPVIEPPAVNQALKNVVKPKPAPAPSAPAPAAPAPEAEPIDVEFEEMNYESEEI